MGVLTPTPCSHLFGDLSPQAIIRVAIAVTLLD